MANNAIGILFEVQGGGDINGASGKRINGQLRNLIGQINKSDTVKLKFQIDSNYFNQQIKQLQQQLQSLSAGGSPSGGGKGSSQTSQTQQQTKAYREATKAVQEYYDALTKYERRASKNANAETEYSALHQSLDMARQKAEQYFNLVDGEFQGIKDSISGLTEEQVKMLQTFESARSIKFDADFTDIQNNAENAWSGLTAKVHDYISRVEESASRNKKAAEALKELRDMANSTDYRGYDKLKQKLSEVQQYINENALATETWGQKMIKTFGSRVRSALAGIIVAKVGQYIKEVYESVVELDKALVNLQIASGKTREETKLLIQEYANLAKQLGATTTEIAESADTWLRQGYSAEEANTLIANSTMLSKLGQIEAADAATALTSAMKGYNVTVEDSIRIIDKFTAVDMAAAASAGDIATAMAETATSARIAGVSMDKLIGYIATVKEVTQDGAESVGTFYKTLFARMNNVAAGNFIDEETGESLNDVETVLNELGIKLRDVNGEFRNSGKVLDEVAERWNTFDSVAQHAIATAFAGTRQQEKFTTLMEHYGEAMEYAEIATGSAGTAVEKYNVWLEGIEGKLNTLKTTFQELAMAILDSELITGVFDFVTWLLEALTGLVDIIGGLNTVLYATVAIVAILKSDAIITFIMSIGTAITKVIAFITSFIASIKIAKAEGISAGQFISNAFHQITAGASTAQLAVAAFVAVISVLVITINAIKQAQDKAIQSSLNSANTYLSEAQAAKEDADSLDALIKKYEELAEKNNGVWDDKTAQTVKGIQDEIVDLVGDQALALDLVNGKLETELGILKDIAGESNKVAIAAAQSALKDAEVAVQSSMGKWRTGDNQYFDIGTGGNKTYGRVKTKTVTRSIMGAGSLKYDTIKTEFDTAKEFAEQYEAVLEYKNSVANTIDETNAWEVEMYKEVNEFLEEFKDVYTTYKSAQDLITRLTTQPETGNSGNVTEEIKGVTVALKSAYDILEEVSGGYDGLVSVLTDVTSEGYLTADALATLFKLEKDNALAGLELADILTQDANGYKLAENALHQYVQALIAAYTVEGAFATQQDKENAIANLENLRSVLATLMATQEESTDANKAYREELKKEQDMYEDQLDKFEELIDLRKNLLQTYQEELNYQKELEKRQRNVTALQAKLSVARLDQSAAGQARVRELEAELKEAQDDLEDFTLEHAIDILTDQLDSTNAEWKAIIQSKLDEIARLLEGLDTTPEVNINIDTSWMQSVMKTIDDSLAKIAGKNVIDIPKSTGTTFPATKTRWTSYQDAVDAGYGNIAGASSSEKGRVVKQYGSYQAYLDAMYEKYMGKAPVYHTGGFVGRVSTLDSNEEFAKLLKGEFVSTPAQMKRFMEETLPSIASYQSGGNNEFNAPLIEIKCDNVTSESLPKFERVVDEAVKEIQKQLNSGMSRAGHKRPQTKRLNNLG